MTGMTGADVRAAAGEMTRVLRPVADRDWTVRAGDLEWSCWTTAAHVAHDLLGYAGQVTGRPDREYLPFDLRVRPNAPVADVLAVVAASAGLLAAAVDTAAPDTRAWPCCTPTTSPGASSWAGTHRRSCASACWTGCSPTHRPATRSRCCSG
ncbi:hypothetical protein ACNAW0_12625 [Micromonospora sp. SL1-18]|uniref:hypothetical protein n=1 Tax=Micromonospora sp. SL1-18 TaxID=3399128 RepID=UPI003A4D56A1